MTHFTVDITTAPIRNGNWSLLRSVLDTVPGTILLEDAESPRLMIPVEAETPLKAATFVDGVSSVIGFVVENGSIYETPEIDFDVEEDHPALTDAGPNTAAMTVRNWFDELPPTPQGKKGRHAFA